MIKNKNAFSILTLILSISSIAHAEEKRHWSYFVPAHVYVPGQTIKNVENGYTIGIEIGEMEGIESAPTSIENYYKNRLEVAQKNMKMLRSFGAERSIPGESDLSSSNEEAVERSDEKESRQESLDLEVFSACAELQLVHLKRILFLKSSQENESKLLSFYESKVRETRGNGSDGYVGLACGRFLGNLGFDILSEVEEVKVLSSFVVRKNLSEQELLLKILTLAHHSEVSVAVRKLWQLFWKKISFISVMTPNAPLPQMEELVDEFAAFEKTVFIGPEDEEGKKTGKVRVNIAQVKELVRQGEEIYKKLRESE